MNKELTWREIKGLHHLYIDGYTTAKIQNHDYIKFLLRRGFITQKTIKGKRLEATAKFYPEYENEGMKQSYETYFDFLSSNELLNPSTQFSEFEIKCLMTMQRSKTILDEVRAQILEGKESRNGVSNKFFKSAKHIQKESALERAVLKIVGVNNFPKNDHLGFYKIPCKTPQCIIICENMHFLTLTTILKHNVELWCAGGNNTKPFERLDIINYPIFYLCDWDYDGLRIYERVYEIINRNQNKICDLQLIYPNGKREKIADTEENHRSRWNFSKSLSGLSEALYTAEQHILINDLIKKNEWIEEEGNDIEEIIVGLDLKARF